MLGKIDRYAVRCGELDLHVAAPRHFIGFGIGTMNRARLLDPGPPLRHALDFETDLVQARVLGRALRGGRVVVLELQDREVYVAVAQIPLRSACCPFRLASSRGPSM
jgi:hypothetical protein